MAHLKKSVFLFLFSVALLFAKEIVIKDIRIKGNWYTKEYVIRRLLPLKVGAHIPDGQLEKSIKEIREVLINTNYFYDVVVYRLHSEVADSATIMIEITEGFLWRLGGGGWYGIIGKENIGGEALAIFLALGTNLQSFDLRKRFLFSSPFGVRLGTGHHFGEFDKKEFEEIFILSSLFYEFSPYIHIQTGPRYTYINYEKKSYYNYGLGFDLKINKKDDTFYPKRGTEINLNTIFYSNYQKYIGSLSYYKPLPGALIWALNVQAGLTGGAPPYYELFDIHSPDLIRAINFDQHIGKHYYFARVTLKKKLFNFPFLFFNMFTDFALFFDIARLENWDGFNKEGGLEFGIHFPNPVFVHINFFGAMVPKEKKIGFTISSQI